MTNEADLAQRLQAALGPGYQVREPLGAGGFAVVYQVRDLGLKRKLAVKVLSPDLITSKTVLERFRREAETVAQLSHPHIVPLHFIGQQDELLYLAMQCIDGGSLADRMAREGPLTIAESTRILSEVASALAYAHKRGVIHRDIKPQNVLLEAETGRALLTDFGIARTAEGSSLTATGMLVGTPAYLSPEQVSGESSDHRADIYAWGVVGYEMLAGQPPFTGPSPMAVMMKRLAGTPPSLEKVREDTPAPLRAVIERMLAPEPADRFQSAGEVVAALAGERLLPSTASGRAKRSNAKRNAGLLVAGLLVGLGVVAAGRALLAPKGTAVLGPLDAGMMLIGGGDYTIGADAGRIERPAHLVSLSPYGIDATEVTTGAYAEFVRTGKVPAPWREAPDNTLPVTGVSYAEAVLYCAWKHPPSGRLPTEAEWEAAARGASGRRFPWGDSWRAGLANTSSARRGGPAPVGSYTGGSTPEGVRDLAGNVWEWTMTPMQGYPGNALPDSLRRYYVIRGGAFDTPDTLASATYRAYASPTTDRSALARTGFRCVMMPRELGN